MRVLIAALLLFGTLGACAEDARRYAVLSLIGDRLLVSQYNPAIGARLDTNKRDYIALDDNVLDKAALLAANQAITKLDPAAKPILMVARDMSLYEAPAESISGTSPLFLKIGGMLKGSGATHLILVTKLRREARIKMHDSTVGTGMLEGVGFYIDNTMGTRDSRTGESGSGLLGPFVYARLELVEAASGKALAEEVIVATRAYSPASTNATIAWEALSSAQKVRALREMIGEEIGNAVPRLLRQSTEKQTP
jgi:hypothetical protein